MILHEKSGKIAKGQKTDILLLRGENFVPFRGVSSILLQFNSTQIAGMIHNGKSTIFSHQELTKPTSNELVIPSAVYTPVDLRFLLPKAQLAR